MVSLEKNQTYSLVRLPTGKKASKCSWIFRVKEEQDGRKKYKARLVVKGFQQIHKVDYNEIFSPVVKMTTISDLDEDIYMTQLEGFQLAGKEENLVCKLKNSWNKEPCRDVHQVGDEREVEVLHSFNWPPSELITDDGFLPERGYSQFNDVSLGYLVLKVS
ncbi:retrovirus-related pol polyprotein from transposon TNT 1-94 [Tanacetum coccineum]